MDKASQKSLIKEIDNAKCDLKDNIYIYSKQNSIKFISLTST